MIADDQFKHGSDFGIRDKFKSVITEQQTGKKINLESAECMGYAKYVFFMIFGVRTLESKTLSLEDPWHAGAYIRTNKVEKIDADGKPYTAVGEHSLIFLCRADTGPKGEKGPGMYFLDANWSIPVNKQCDNITRVEYWSDDDFKAVFKNKWTVIEPQLYPRTGDYLTQSNLEYYNSETEPNSTGVINKGKLLRITYLGTNISSNTKVKYDSKSQYITFRAIMAKAITPEGNEVWVVFNEPGALEYKGPLPRINSISPTTASGPNSGNQSPGSFFQSVWTTIGDLFRKIVKPVQAAPDENQSATENVAYTTPTEDSRDVTTPIQAATPVLSDLQGILVRQDRDAFETWADKITINELNQQIAMLSNDQKENLCTFLLESNATSSERTLLIKLMNSILSEYDLGFFAHIFSYTSIDLTGDGFFYRGNGTVELAKDSFLSLSEKDKRNTLMHECFHSFNDRNQGPKGALNEGSAIWVYKRAFGTDSPAEDFAEATFGTKLYYKTFMNEPDYPLVAPAVFNSKLVEVYSWLSTNDPSRLPWWDTELLNEMYNRYYASLDRDVDYYSVWLPSVQKAREAMLLDLHTNLSDKLPELALSTDNLAQDYPPVDKPVLISPSNGSTFKGSAPTLKWNSISSPSGGQVKYIVETFDCPSQQNSGWITGTSWTPTSTAAGIYNWHVKAIDVNTGKESGYGNVWQYTYVNDEGSGDDIIAEYPPADKPSLISPSDGSMFAGSVPTLRWSNISSPSGGQVKYFVETFDCPSQQNSGWITGTSWTPASTAAGIYNWHVKAIDVNTGKESGYGNVWQYTIAASNNSSDLPLDIRIAEFGPYDAQDNYSDQTCKVREMILNNAVSIVASDSFFFPAGDPGPAFIKKLIVIYRNRWNEEWEITCNEGETIALTRDSQIGDFLLDGDKP